mmetsp:Transcript_91855/g.239482  ORF Transcript_91855/g.239482 Transcript_91855/m.239482 type:complete len:96 (-) Transcript_91855:201-488(-)
MRPGNGKYYDAIPCPLGQEPDRTRTASADFVNLVAWEEKKRRTNDDKAADDEEGSVEEGTYPRDLSRSRLQDTSEEASRGMRAGIQEASDLRPRT